MKSRIGLGGLVPAASALAAELVPANWRSSVATFMLSGVPIGGIAASLVGIELIPRYGWRVMFYIPVIAILVLLPLAIRHIPETLEIPHGKQAVKDHAGYGYKALLRPPYRNASIALSLAAMGTMFAWYGLGTWLPSLMQLKGYDLGSSLSFAIALNCGAVAGSAVTAWAGDRYSPMLSGAVAALLASGSLLAMMAGPPVAVVFGLLILAGVGTHGTQVLLTSTVTTNWPAELRGTALGWTLGVGRIGAIMAPQVAGLIAAKNPDVNFLTFGGAALLASCMLFLVRPLIRKFSVHPERVH